MKFKRAPLAAYLCLMPVLLLLGFWQLDRAESKQQLLNRQKQQQTAETLLLTGESPDDAETFLYKPAKATGRFDSAHQFLLDNQVYQGKAGYFVLTPMLLKHDKKAVLVNRGWVPVGTSRAILPDINVTQEEVTVTGHINRFPRVGLKLGGSESTVNHWPAVVQVIDSDLLSSRLTYPAFSFQIELEQTQAHGFLRDWRKPAAMTSEKHLSYAVQWFLLALTLTVLFIKFGTERKNV
ncbi:MAG: SURF1 family protein [Gammaproteobacteria bacterium]|nr:SURF1 family protein [Gammaproteobacteria bacterium]